jgi:O-methyltransferase involved in polyketide biosynthesis
LTAISRDNRDFLRRAVVFLCAQGIDQFLDLGSGIPTAGNVHEVAHTVNPRARVVYVDHDPVAFTHSRELLKDTDGVVAIRADLRDPEYVLQDAVAVGGLDLTRPVAVLMVSVLHFLPDKDDPGGLVAGYLRATVPGSYVALSHARSDGQRDAAATEQVYNRSRSPNPMRFRSSAEIAALFGELTVIDPGVVHIPRWRPELGEDAAADADLPVGEDYPALAGVGRRD